MYKILFSGVTFATVKDIENACALALSVHRSSNVEHSVRVLDEKDLEVITFSFFTPKGK